MNARDRVPASHIGKRALRAEDVRLLTGEGRYVADIDLPDALHVAFVRSPHAHALIRNVDGSAALEVPGVVAVIDAREMATYVEAIRMPLGWPTSDLPSGITPYVLCPEEVCFVGEAVAMVLATSRYIAEDGAALVMVDYEPLAAVSDVHAALEPGAPKVRREAPSNVLREFSVGYGECDGAFRDAPHVFRETISQHRGGAHPMECRGMVAQYDKHQGALMIWASTQMPHELAFTVAKALGLPDSLVRVVAPDVGGGFGCKFVVYPEELAVAAVAWHHKRAVKWIEDRMEHFLGAIQERDQLWEVEVACDGQGVVRGIRGTMLHDQGAYTPQGVNCAYNSSTAVTGPYAIPAYEMRVTVVQTNKIYVIPVRGAGYPQGTFVMERLLDRIAFELGEDRATVRARNLVLPEKMPYVKPLTARSGRPIVLDSGDYLDAQRRVLEQIGYAGFEARRQAARREGRYIGLGFAHAVKGTGRGPFESGSVRVSSNGHVTVATGAMAMGQGLNTAMAQIAAEQLCVPVESVQVISGDTAHTSMGVGGFASRQTVTAGSSVHYAAVAVAAKLRKVGATMLKVDESEVCLRDGSVRETGEGGRSVTYSEIARLLRGIPGYDLPPGVGAGLEATIHWEPTDMAYAHGFHACEVEVDIVTGEVRILRYVATHDSGTLINPMTAEGQIHGGIVHGIGNALFECMRYDDQAQPISTTFADYLLTTATEVPPLEISFTESPAPSNPLGVKGVGEAGTIPVTSAIASAIDDALADFRIRVSRVPVEPVELVRQIAAHEQAAG
ncbi:MAG: xanthine dehydrogenase family protein molybdopterin-binding subunit [Alcaligenaceae bacterium]|nr:xanthine dehydrogenase family protein molybdopterin-binding subunit [Alcaligenaceae bacterium SAGV5]MPS28353.1 xanthine dehydrogenase family protein molybdopterin-binding subunit [Alcaligenaceae bacterium SAGV5]MPS51440.1 xanthine dehydrogenase family protein molybdopterin-binding subunit [Alcaligenaceae bacterium SAGV3]MPT56008.1 xanthine dehydrogenase family protein molybdopterin-binding subunit [Alcaligenaceae bacterium]